MKILMAKMWMRRASLSSMRFTTWFRKFALLVYSIIAIPLVANAQESSQGVKPCMRDFIGINGHTVQFKPELYQQVCRVVRDYHPLEWDTGADTDYALDFPFARNRVSWEQVYGSWRKHDFFIDACIMFETVPADKWKSLARDSRYYGQRFAESFGPSSKLALVDAVEIGNEPGKFTDEQYRIVFQNMAEGLRKGDPKLKIATCNVNVGTSGDFHKSVDCVSGLQDLYDVLNVHSYALLEGWPSWRRSYPEDPLLMAYTQDVDRLIQWRNQHAPGKEIWLTEFGWDCSTQRPKQGGDFEKWLDNSDTEQAQWLVRSLLLFSARDVQRAFIYFFNDDDTPQFHGASGLTRNFVPKPSFYAVRHCYQTLGDYRFSKVIQENKNTAYIFEFQHSTDGGKVIWVAWSPTGKQLMSSTKIAVQGMSPVSAERMPLDGNSAESIQIAINGNEITIPLTESPLYIRFHADANN
jgi:hypothetical protein